MIGFFGLLALSVYLFGVQFKGSFGTLVLGALLYVIATSGRAQGFPRRTRG